MKSSRKTYAKHVLSGSKMVSSNRIWSVIFIDEDGLEKTKLAYSYCKLTIDDARQFCHPATTKVYPHTGKSDVSDCDYYLPVFVDIHRYG